MTLSSYWRDLRQTKRVTHAVQHHTIFTAGGEVLDAMAKKLGLERAMIPVSRASWGSPLFGDEADHVLRTRIVGTLLQYVSDMLGRQVTRIGDIDIIDVEKLTGFTHVSPDGGRLSPSENVQQWLMSVQFALGEWKP